MFDFPRLALAPPSALLIQLSSLSFILCGVHNDLFVIRFYVTLSYCLIIVNILLSAHQLLRLDNLLWSLLGLYINGTSLAALIRDERPVALSKDEEALWRLLYRSGGLSQRLFASIVAPHLQIKYFPVGEVIPTSDQFYVVYKGLVRLKVYDDDNVLTLERRVRSGQMFDLRYLELFSDYSDNFFKKGKIVCTTETPCQLFCFARKDIRQIAHHPLAKGVWQSLLINDIAIRADTFTERQEQNECDAIFDPLQEWEIPETNFPGSGSALKRPITHFFTSLWRSLLLPWPFGAHQQGIRQTLLPAPQFRPTSRQTRIRVHRSSGRSKSSFDSSLFVLTRWASRFTSSKAAAVPSESHNGESPVVNVAVVEGNHLPSGGILLEI